MLGHSQTNGGLDVHVLVMPDTPAAWVTQRRASLDAAVAAAGFQVRVHEVPGVPGHIGLARAAGYAAGDAAYVTYVDDDDWVEPEAFAALVPYLNGVTDAVFTHELIHSDDGGVRESAGWHHLCVYRRSILAEVPFEALTWAVDIHCRHVVQDRVVAEVKKPVYHYRANGRSAQVRIANPRESAPRPFDAEAMPASHWRSL